jgi:Bax protein
MVAAPAPPGDLLAALPPAMEEPFPAPEASAPPRVVPEAATPPGRLPPALVDAAPGEARKRLFLEAMVPALVAENERLLERRARILATYDAIDAGGAPAEDELAWLAEIAERHAGDPADRAGLLGRVDAIPLSLGVAQAALESGWGASRGAQEWHGIFGQMSFAPDPGRPVLRRFDGIQDAVAAWALNLNSHRAYARFRAARAKAREDGRAPDGHALAGELLRYSERGEAYVRELRALIRSNGLEAMDRQDERG